jgi:hypothetical protein
MFPAPRLDAKRSPSPTLGALALKEVSQGRVGQHPLPAAFDATSLLQAQHVPGAPATARLKLGGELRDDVEATGCRGLPEGLRERDLDGIRLVQGTV